MLIGLVSYLQGGFVDGRAVPVKGATILVLVGNLDPKLKIIANIGVFQSLNLRGKGVEIATYFVRGVPETRGDTPRTRVDEGC
jgi:hypothetical protein